MSNATHARDVIKFTDIPNIGPAMERVFRFLGLKKPTELKTKEAFRLYQLLCKTSGKRQDLCVLDTFMAAIDFMNGTEAKPWYFYTKERKKKYPHL